MARLGRFTIEEEIGRGAMGVVYRAIHPGLDIPVAIKVLDRAYSSDPGFRKQFRREAATIAALNHPGIVRVFDFDQARDSLFIVMELVDGHSVQSWMRHGGRFTIEAALDLVRQVLSAASAAHSRRIVHRDLKPANLILTDQGRIKILDFGIAALCQESPVSTQSEVVFGTPTYMSPEQAQGEAVDHRSDIYSIGILLYELLHGRPPFTGSVPAILRAQVTEQAKPSPAIPRPLMDVIWKATAKDAAQRYSTCSEFTVALAARAQLTAPTQRPPLSVTIEMDLDPQPEPEAESTELETKPEQAGGVCRHTGCQAREGWQCSYRDDAKNTCPTWWCQDHVVFVESVPYCRRHASVMRAILPMVGTIHEIKVRPTVDDRSFSLAALVGTDVDKEVCALLQRRLRHKSLEVVGDVGLRRSWSRREVSWERSWSVLHQGGYLLRITIRVAAARPTVVQVTDGKASTELTPDWISNRLARRPTGPLDRSVFCGRVLEAVEEAIERNHAAVLAAVPASRGKRRAGR